MRTVWKKYNHFDTDDTVYKLVLTDKARLCQGALDNFDQKLLL